MIETDKLTELIGKWLIHTASCEQMKRDEFDSIDIEELLDTSVENQLEIGFQAYAELVNQYMPMSKDFTAELVMTLEYSDEFKIHTFEDLLNQKVELRQPPELYLVKRSILGNYLAAEEYKRAFSQDKVHTSHGSIYSYYQALRTLDDDTYTLSYTFQHHIPEA